MTTDSRPLAISAPEPRSLELIFTKDAMSLLHSRYRIVEADPDVSTDPSTPEFRRVVELAIRMKAEVVGEDFREACLREILNYGHTLGHAVEHAERYQWRHGASVAVQE